MKTIKKVFSRIPPLNAIVAAGLLLSSQGVLANQKISDIFGNLGDEASAIVPIFLLLVAAAGICVAAVAVISGIMEKKKNQPLTWQVGGVIGGALAVIIPLVIMAFTGSLTGADSEASTIFNELNVEY